MEKNECSKMADLFQPSKKYVSLSIMVILLFMSNLYAQNRDLTYYKTLNNSLPSTNNLSEQMLTEYSKIFCIEPEPEFDKAAILDKAFTKFLAGDVNELLLLTTDSMVFEVSGPYSDSTHYGKYIGKKGFVEFCMKAYKIFNVEQFDVHYYVSEGYDVNVLIREKFLFKASGARSIAEFNEHVKFNKEGKVIYFGIIQDTYSQLLAIGGNENDLFFNKNLNEEIIVLNYPFPPIYNKALGWMVYEAFKTGKFNKLEPILSSNAEFVMGNKNIAPYSGKHSGKKQINHMLKAFIKEIDSLEIIKIVCENNKIELNLQYHGCASSTGIKYEGKSKLSLQLDGSGQIAKAYYFFDQYTTFKSYQKQSFPAIISFI